MILKDNKDMTVDEIYSIGINVTTTGLPDDCTYLSLIQVNREFKLTELKETIMTLEYFKGKRFASECIRIRDKLNN